MLLTSLANHLLCPDPLNDSHVLITSISLLQTKSSVHLPLTSENRLAKRVGNDRCYPYVYSAGHPQLATLCAYTAFTYVWGLLKYLMMYMYMYLLALTFIMDFAIVYGCINWLQCNCICFLLMLWTRLLCRVTHIYCCSHFVYTASVSINQFLLQFVCTCSHLFHLI